MSASSIIKYFSTPHEIKTTRPYELAKKYTLISYAQQRDKKYLNAWKTSMPAKVCYLIDLIFHVCMIPITLLKAFFGTIKAIYSWGDDTTFLQKNLEILHFHVNTAMADTIGIFITKAGIKLRDNNNVRDFITISVLVASVCLGYYALKKADNFKIIYDPQSNSFKPALNWKL